MVQPSIVKSHKRSKMIETHFYRLNSTMNGSKIIADPLKSMAPNFVLVVSVLLLNCCHIGSGMTQLRIFVVEEFVPLLEATTDRRV